MSTVLQTQETKIWGITPDYFLNQANPNLNNGFIREMLTNTYNVYDNTSGICYLFVPQKEAFSTFAFTGVWIPTAPVTLPEFKNVKLSKLDTSCLASAKRNVESFLADLQTSVEGIFYNVEDDPDHQPGFIICILVVIPESNRDLEHGIYSSLGKLMRNNSKLLIDMHIIKRRGRQTRELVPPEYQEVR
jgi:hypothetical protein